MLTLFNTLTGKPEPFKSLEPNKVRMYVCGVTVYDYCHIGHARSALVFDVLRRYLEHIGYEVEFVKNFTDVEDKIIARAQKEGVSCEAITAKYIKAYYEDMERLGIRPASEEPKATEHVTQIVELVQQLISQGVAYRVDGDVYFEVGKYSAYGRLSKRKPEDLLAGARVDVDGRKRHPMDFALWKSSKPGEPSWNSPWGLGRPGWHIECSAMAIHYLGETFDIHGGGMDLIFPHHENEIAQSSSATGKEFARYWVHNGFVQVNQEKMSKSLGNFFTIREVFDKSAWSQAVTGEILRYFMLSTHYHGPLDFSDQALSEAKYALNGFYDLFNRLAEPGHATQAAYEGLKGAVGSHETGFKQAMDNDLNTPLALAELQELRGEINKLFRDGLSTDARREAREAFRVLGKVLGLFQLEPNQWQFNPPMRRMVNTVTEVDEALPITPIGGLTQEAIETKIAERAEAKKQKDFKRADAIRAELASLGVTIEDKPDGTSRWKR